jgi:hypothetical protein
MQLRNTVPSALPEALVGDLNVGGCAVSDIVKAVLNHNIHPFYQVLVVNLRKKVPITIFF